MEVAVLEVVVVGTVEVDVVGSVLVEVVLEVEEVVVVVVVVVVVTEGRMVTASRNTVPSSPGAIMLMKEILVLPERGL